MEEEKVREVAMEVGALPFVAMEVWLRRPCPCSLRRPCSTSHALTRMVW